jgi:hypothetical protein
MDELTMVRDLGRQVPLPDADRLAPARALLLAEVLTEARPRRRSRRLIAGLTTAGLAAAAAAVLIVAAPAHQADPTPTDFLYAAADAVLAQPDVVPRPDQFVYVDFRMIGGKRYESWSSIDGKHDGLTDGPDGRRIDRACPDGKPDAIPEQGGGCVPNPRYLPDMPADTDAMIAWLRERNPNDSQANITNGIAKDIMSLSMNFWLRSEQRAALYRAATQLPGLRLVPDSTDAAGRKGTGVTWERAEGDIMWIFDPATHILIGSPGYTSSMALVDKVGDRS